MHIQNLSCQYVQRDSNILVVKKVTSLSKSHIDFHCCESAPGMHLRVIESSTQRKVKHIAHCFFLPHVGPRLLPLFYILHYVEWHHWAGLQFIPLEMVNCAREKLDCCLVTIKVSSFIVKAPNCPPRKEILAATFYKRTSLKKQVAGTLFSPSKSQAVWGFSSASVCWPCSVIKLGQISLISMNWLSSMAHYNACRLWLTCFFSKNIIFMSLSLILQLCFSIVSIPSWVVLPKQN